MQKFLRMLTLTALLLVPWVTQAQTPLFSEDFEGGSMPTGWTTDGSGSWSVGTGDYSSGTGAGQGTYNAKITHGTTGNQTKLITPAIDLTGVSSAVLSYMHIERSWAGDIDELRVYYRNDTTGTWTLLSGQEFTGAVSAWTTESDIILPNLSNTYQIAFEFTDRYGYGLGIDSVVIVQGSSCTSPTDLTVSNITSTGATFSWTSTVGNYVFEYKAASADTWTTLPLTSNTTTLTNLQPGTSYNARVKAVCGAGIESSYRTANFMTVYGVPFSESFSTSSVPTNWNRYTGLLSEILGGTSNLASTTSGWYCGNYNGVFDNHTRVNIYGTTCKYWLVTPTISIGNNVQLTFDLALTAYSGTVAAPSTSGTDDKFVVLITTDGGTTWTVLRQWDNAGSSYVYNNITCSATGEIVAIDLSSYAGQTIAVAFYGESTASNADNNLHIDNVSIDYIPACPTPTQLAVNYTGGTTAQVSWNSDATLWNIKVNGTETYGLTANPTTITGLDYGTTYTIQVQANCGGDTSEWTSPVSFTTDLCDTINQCALTITITDAYGDGGGQIQVVDTVTNTVLGTYTNSSYSTTYTLNVCNGRTLNFVFASTDSWPYENGWVITDINEEVVSSHEGCRSSGTCDAPTNGVVATYTVDCTVSSCHRPTALAASEVGPRSVQLGWTENGEATSWVVAYAPAGDTIFTEVAAATNPYTLTGLNPETAYTVKVRPVCSDQLIRWSDPISFTTDVACPAPTSLAVTPGPTVADVNWNGNANNYTLQYTQVPTGTISTGDSIVLSYDDGSYASGIGNSTAANWTWGVMYPASMYMGGNLTKVSVFETASFNDTTYTVKIYSGGTTAPDSLLASQVVTPMGSDGFHEITLTTPVTIDLAQNLWIVVEAYGTYVMSSCNSTNPNNTWVYDNGSWGLLADLVSSLAGRGWMIRGQINPFDLDALTWTTVNNATAPASLTGLTTETDYITRVKAVCGGQDGESAWETSLFTTLEVNPIPMDVVVTPAATRAAISWRGYSDSYKVYYRTAEVENVVFSEGFESDIDTTLWKIYTVGEAPQTNGWYTYNPESGLSYSAHGGSMVASAWSWNNSAYNADNWLVTPQVTLGGTLKYWERTAASWPDHYEVIVSTTGNTVADFANGTVIRARAIAATTGDWNEVTLDLSAFSGQAGYIAFHHADTDANYLLIDDLRVIGSITPAGAWVEVPTTATNVTLTGLTPETTYDYKVTGIVNNVENAGTDIAQFTTDTQAFCPAPVITVGEFQNRTASFSWTCPGDSVFVTLLNHNGQQVWGQFFGPNDTAVNNMYFPEAQYPFGYVYIYALTVCGDIADSNLSDWAYDGFAVTCDTTDQCTVSYVLHGQNGWQGGVLDVFDTVSGAIVSSLTLPAGLDTHTTTYQLCTDRVYRVAFRDGTGAGQTSFSNVAFEIVGPFGNTYFSASNPDTGTLGYFTHSCTAVPCVVMNPMIGDSTSTTTSYYTPVNNYFNYTLSETIIDAAEIGGPMTINTISYYYNYATAMTNKTNCTIYLQPTSKSVFASSSDIDLLDPASAVMVYTGDLNCVQGWNTFTLTTPYYYDGQDNLMVIVDDNSGSYNGSSYTFRTSACTGYKTLYWNSDSYNPDPTNGTFSGSKGYQQYRVVMNLDGCQAPAATCIKPTTIAETHGANNATVSWSGNASNYSVTLMDATGAVLSYATTIDSNYTFTGLTGSTDYTVAVRALCSDADSSSAKTISFHTECDMLATLPFTYGFEDAATGSTSNAVFTVECWKRLNNATGSYKYPYVSSSNTHAGSRSLYWYSSTSTTATYGTYQMVALPGVGGNYTMSGLRLKFWSKASSAGYRPVFYVGVMTDSTDYTTFVATDTIAVNTEGNTNYAEYIANLSGYTGTGRYVAIAAQRPASSLWYAYMDDITLEVAPTCVEPTDVTVDNITTNSAVVSWTGTANGFTVAYGTGTNPDAMTTVSATGTSTTLTGLMPNTAYNVYVKAVCSATDQSPWTNATTFRTNCVALTAADLPYFDNFDSHTTSTTAATGVNVPCWTLAHQDVTMTDAQKPQIYYSTTASYNHSGNYTLRLYYRCIYALPEISANINQLQMNFWVRQTTSTYKVVVGVMSDLNDATTFVPIDTIDNGSNTTTMEQHTVYFNNYTGNGHYIAFRNIHTSYNYSYNFIDDVTVDYMPSCFPVTNITAADATDNSITLTWADASNTGATYTVSDGSSVIASGITGTTYTVTGLTANTEYTFYVTANCSATDASTATGVTGRTACAAEAFPFYEDFSANLSSNVCWRGATGTSAAQAFAGTQLNLTTQQWSYASSVKDGFPAGHYYKNIYGSSTSQLCWMITPTIDLSNATSAQLEFDVALTDYNNAALPDANGDTNTSQAFMVIVSTDGGNTWSANNATVWQNGTGDYTYASLADTVYQHKTISLNQYVGGTVKIAFYTQSLWSGGDNDLHLDNIAVTGDTATPQEECWPMPLVIGNENSTTTSYNTPVNNYYNYTLSETIIDQAEIGGAMPINGIRYYFNYASPMTSKTNCTIYLQPTTKTAFSSSSDIELLDSSTAVMVYTGALNCSQGWNEFTFDTPYQYDGTSNLMVIVDDNSGSYNTSSHTFRTSACTGYKTLYWYSDSENPDPTTNTFSGSKSYLQSRVVMALVTCDTATCHAPVVAEATTVGANNATVVWTNSNAAAYSVILMSGSSVVSYNTTVDTTYTFTGLTDNSDYSVEIRALCSATDSSAAITANFHTECDMLAPLPYTYGFEGATTGSSSNAVFTVECWKRLNNATGSFKYPYVSSSTCHTGTRSLYWYSSTSTTASYGTYQMVVLRGVGGNYVMSDLRLKFWSKVTTATYRPVFYVGVMTDPNDHTTFVATDTVAVNTEGNTNYAEYIAYLTGYTGTGRYVAIAAQRPASTSWYAYMDDITLEEMPSCVEVVSVDATNITSSSAMLTWVDNYNTSATYTVSDASGVIATGITGNSYTVTGLNPGTQYTFNVTANCSATETTQPVSVTFYTACVALTANDLPSSETFESYGSGSAYSISPCWTKGTNSSTAYPYPTSTAANGTRSLYFYGYKPSSTSSTSIYSYAALPELAASVDVTDLTVSFKARRYSSTSVYYRSLIHVGVMTDPTDVSTFQAVDTINMTPLAASTIENYSVNLANYAGTGKYVAFYCPWIDTSTSYSYNYIYIDDVVLDVTPSCEAPAITDVTYAPYNNGEGDYTATVTWNSTGAQSYEFQWIEPSLTRIISNGNDTVHAFVIHPDEASYVKVRAICGAGDTSAWSDSVRLYYGYCEPTPTSVDNQGVTSVAFGGMTNTTSHSGNTAAYVNNRAMVGTVQAGTTATVDITYATGYDYGTIIWVDWNKNYTFDGNEVVYVGTSASTNPTTLNASFVIPATQDTGDYVMRIVGADSYFDSYVGSIAAAATANPCGTYSWGIAEDYTLHVSPAAAVLDSTVFVVSVNDTTMGTVLPNVGTMVYHWGDNVNFTAVPNTGYNFDYWLLSYGNLTDTLTANPVSGTIDSTDANQTYYLTAVFVPQPDSLTLVLAVNDATMGSTTPAPGTYRYGEGDVMTATAIPAAGYVFDYWVVNIAGLAIDTVYTATITDTVLPVYVTLTINATAHFSACPTVAFPFSENFEGGVMPACWSTDGPGNWTVGTGDYSTATGAHSGSYNAKITHSSTGNNTKFITPAIDMTGVASAELRFWHVQRTWSGDQDELTVYYRTSATDTWHSLASYTSAITTWTEEVIALPNLSSTYQIAFEMYDGYGYGVAIDDITIALPPACAAVTGLTASNVTNNSVTLTWSDNQNTGATYTVYQDSTVLATGINDTTYTITGLTGRTAYTFGVVANCSADLASTMTTLNVTTAADPIMCGNDMALVFSNADSITGTTNYFPGYCLYNYSYSEVIVPATAIEGLGEIKGLEYYVNSITAGSTYYNNCEIYLMNTTATSLANGFVQDANNFQLVYNGDLNNTETGWRLVTFDTSFTYDGVSNLLVAVRRSHGDWASSCPFGAYTASTQLARYVYNDNNAYTIGSITGGTATTTVPVYHLIGCQGVAPECSAIRNLTASNVTFTSVTLTWTDTVNTGATYTVYSDSTVVATGVTGTTYTVTGLTANTNYTFSVVANCSATAESLPISISVYTGYCTPTPTSVDNSGITSVSFGGMTNTTSHAGNTAAFVDNTSLSGSVPAGTTATVDITYATGYTYGTIIWVDWNNNLSFDGNEVVAVGTSTSDNPTTLTLTFDIPATQALGSYRMRIVGADSYFDSYTGSIAAAAGANPCGSYSYGVAEDYTLNVNNCQTTYGFDTVVVCDSTVWNGNTYTQGGTYSATLTNAAGCDSIVTLSLTVNNSTTGAETISACDSYTLNGITYTATTTVVDTLTTAAGCDSVVTITLTVNHSTTHTDTVNAVDSYTWHGTTYIASTVAYDTLVNTAGCDSICTLVLTVTYSGIVVTDTAEACDSYTWRGTTYTASTVATDTVHNAAGADSIYMLILTVNYSQIVNDTVTACDSYLWHGVTYTASTTAADTLQTVAGCDSICTLVLTVNHGATGTDFVSGCDSVMWNNTVYTASATVVDTLQTVEGCDSIVTVTLVVNNSVTTTETVTMCDSYTWNGVTYTASTVDTAVYAALNGCDSTVVLNLTINYSTETIDSVDAVDSYTWRGNTYYVTTVAHDTLPAANGCDSVLTLVLNMTYSASIIDTVVACDSATWHGRTYYASTVDYDTVTPDSIYMLLLTVNYSQYDTVAVTARGQYVWHDNIYTVSGTYNYYDQTDEGCDWVETLILTIDSTADVYYSVAIVVANTEGEIGVGGTVTGAGSYLAGTEVTLTATPDEGYLFNGWYTRSAMGFGGQLIVADSIYTFTLDSNVVVVAMFERIGSNSALLTVSVDSTMGYVLFNGERAPFNVYRGTLGDTVTLEAVPMAGNCVFVGWVNAEGDTLSHDATYDYVLDRTTTTLTAAFVRNEGINNVDATSVTIFTRENGVVVRGAAQAEVYVFDVVGRMVGHVSAANDEEFIRLPQTGVFLVKVGNLPARRVVVRQ